MSQPLRLAAATVAAAIAGIGLNGYAGAAAQTQGPARPPQSQVARVSDLIQMMAALRDTAPATPKQPRHVLVVGRAAGFVHVHTADARAHSRGRAVRNRRSRGGRQPAAADQVGRG